MQQPAYDQQAPACTAFALGKITGNHKNPVMNRAKEIGLSLLGTYINLVRQFKTVIIILFIVLFAVCVNYTINNLEMNTDTRDMLSPELEWRKLDIDYESNFPHVIDNILVVIEADTPDQAADAALLLYARLLDETALFRSFYLPMALSIFRENGLLYLDADELQDISDNIARIQPFLAKLTDDYSLRGLFTMLTDVIDAKEAGHDIDLQPLISQLDTAVRANLDDKPFRVSWQSLIDGETVNPDAIHREYLFLQPILDYGLLFPAEAAINKIRALAADTDFRDTGAGIRLTGTAVLAHEEFLNVSQGTGLAVILSLCAVALIMTLGLRSMRLVVFTLTTLITGLIFTAAFATLAVGELNLISVAFAVLYIGLGVDFAIHYCLRYRELMIQGTPTDDALANASINVGSSLFICSVTTAIGFFAFIPTDYQGVAELGLISGTGMFISLFVTLTLLPALLALMPVKPEKLQAGTAGIGMPWKITMLPVTHAGLIKLISIILVLAAIVLVSNIRFDYNILNLQNPENESVMTYTDLLADSSTSPWSGVVVANDKEDAQNTAHSLASLPVVDTVVWLDDFIPADQDEKLGIIDTMNLLLAGGLPEPGEPSPLQSEIQYQALVQFLANHEDLSSRADTAYLQVFLKILGSYVDHLAGADAESRSKSLARLSASMLASLPGRISSLNASLKADYITYDNLPDEFREQWMTDDGRYLLHVYPVEDLNDNIAMRRFVEQIQAVEPRITGAPVVNIEAGDAVMTAFKEAFTYAFIAITLFLLLLLQHKRDVAFVLIPLIFAVLMTGGLSVALDIPLNFANIIALPLLLGIGVDSSIHILHRFRTALPNHNNILATSSARAVVVSTLTTMGSIGNLAFSPHTGTASMGMLLTTGIAMTLLATLVLLPSLLATPRSETSTQAGSGQ